ncbi:MAG: hypothetical protein IJ727_11190 [Treponema sp.]|nr:hypothetical protein [Treponema sp.]
MAWNLHDRDVEKKSKLEVRTETAKKLLKLGLSLENIAEVTTLPVEVIKNLK